MAKTYQPITNEQYCRMNTLYSKLKGIAPWSIMIDVKCRREMVMLGKASVRTFNGFMRHEIARLEAAVN